MLELIGVYLKHENKYLLQDISLHFELGTTYILTGNIESGKEILMKVMGGIIEPTIGIVALKGHNIYSRARYQVVKNKFGFVFQDGVMLANLSICENLMLPLHHLYVGHDKQEALIRIQELFAYFDISTALLNKRPADVSYTTRKIINFIRAVLINPEIYFINMPLFNLNVSDRQNFISYLQQIKESGKIIIMSTNNRILFENLADRVILLDKGRIRAFCQTEEFLNTKDPDIIDYLNTNIG